MNKKAIETAAALLRQGGTTTLLVGGESLMEAPLLDAFAITQHTGAKLIGPVSPARIERGRGRVPLMRIPYPVDQALESLAGTKNLILVGTAEPVAFFAYPGKPGYLKPEGCNVHVLARPDEDGPRALRELLEMLGAPRIAAPDPGPRPARATGKVGPEKVAQSLAALMPAGSIVVDEAISFGRGFYPYTFAAEPHDWLQLTGGAIGAGIPMAVGAAVGAPGRRVVALQADGSAMYTLAGLWTQARENLDITTVILSNRKYAILLHELANVGANPGRTALNMLDLSNPDINWTQLANGMGVESARAESMEELNTLLAASFERAGPFLIELII